jgi:hypothetical protein
LWLLPITLYLGILVRKLRIIYVQLSDNSTLGQVTKSYERTLIIAGHIFAEKRRKPSVRTFSDLVVVKLNVKPLNKSDFNHETM